MSAHPKRVADTLEILSNVATNTYVSERILKRPPFSFIHKLLLEVLGPYQLFTSDQKLIAKLQTRELKASFITRALAWVNFALERFNDPEDTSVRFVNVLLLVSPIKVLAGVEVDRTVEFLYQLGFALTNTEKSEKLEAVKKVCASGDAELYTSAVKCRNGIARAQAITRGKIFRQASKSNGLLKIEEQQQPPSSEKPRTDSNEMMLVGHEFFKEFEGFGIYKGIVQSYDKESKHYSVYYPEDGDEEELDESELLSLIKISRQRYPGPIGTENVYTPPTRSSIATRSSNNVRSGQQQLSSLEEKLPPPEVGKLQTSPVSTPISKNQSYQKQQPWQEKYKTLLEQGKRNDLETSESLRMQAMGNSVSAINFAPLSISKPVLPKLIVPGGSKEWKARLRPPVKEILVTDSSSNKTAKKKKKKTKEKDTFPAELNSIESPKQVKTSSFYEKEREKSIKKLNRLKSSQSFVQEKSQDLLPDVFKEGKDIEEYSKTLISEVVTKLESHLKRKQMRVLDLFRNTDADGNGYITQDEMVAAMAQLDITLSKKNAQIVLELIDEDGNGVIDVEEFDHFIRMSRRVNARKEALAKELVKQKHSEKKKEKLKYRALIKHQQRILDLCSVLDVYEEGIVSTIQFRSAMGRLALKDVPRGALEDMINRAVDEEGNISIRKITALLHNTESKKNNYLDNTWLSQFDKRLDAANKA